MAENEHVIQTFSTHASYPAFRDGIGPWGSDRCSNLPDAEGSNSLVEDSTVAAVAVMNEVTGRVAVTIAGLHPLLRQPLGRGMSGCSGMNDLPPAVIYHEEHVQGPKPDGLNREQIAGPDFLRVLS